MQGAAGVFLSYLLNPAMLQLFFSSSIDRLKNYLLRAEIFSFGPKQDNTPLSISSCWWVGGQAGGHPSLPIWQPYCELYLLTGNLASLVFFLGNKTLSSLFFFTHKTPQQPGGTYIISSLNNEYILNLDLKLFIYSILNQRKSLM